jgi:hypothetical protein
MFSRTELFELFRRRAEFESNDLRVMRALIELGEQFRWCKFFMPQWRIAQHAGVDDTLAVRDAVCVAVACGLIVAEKVQAGGYGRYRYDFAPSLEILQATRIVGARPQGGNVVRLDDFRRKRVRVDLGPIEGAVK